MILAFCEPSNPFHIWNEIKEKFLADFRRRSISSLGNVNDLQRDSLTETYVLNEIQNSFREMTGNLDLEQLAIPKIHSDFSFIASDERLKPKDRAEWKNFDSSIKKFNGGQANVFNSISNETLPGVQSVILMPQ